MRAFSICLAAAVLSGRGAGGSSDASFTRKPSVSRAGGKAVVSFAVSGSTDVEVAVMDPKGGVVRHLAAGLLGGVKAPPEPLKAGLSQSLEWDGLDDFGKAAPGGPFRIRVRAGSGLKFGRFIGDDPCTFGGITSIAADETGNVYIVGHGGNRNQNFRTIRVFDSRGAYVRTVMPFPADLPPDAMKDVAAWDAEAKTFRPRNLSSLNPEFYAEGLTLVSASAKEGLILTDGSVVYRLDARGGVPGPSFAAQALWPKGGGLHNTGGGPVFLAPAPDGKSVFLSGPFSSKTQYGHAFDPKYPPGAVYRMKFGTGETMQLFASLPVDHVDGVGGEWTKKNARNHGIAEGPLHGIAVDSKGQVFVADRGRERVVIFDAGGKQVGELSVPHPHQIAVHPKTGDVYVLSRQATGYWQYVVGVSKFKAGALAARYAFPLQKTAGPQMALVASEQQTAVYCAGVPGDLVMLVDRGGTFEAVKTAFAPQPGSLDVFNRISVDSTREEIYISDGGNLVARFNGVTGEGGLLQKDGKPFHATDLSVGYDGLLFMQTGEGFSGPLERFTRDLAPAPYPSGTHVLSKYIYGRYGIGNCEKGLGAGPDGKVYMSWMTGGWVKYGVSAWDAEGKPLNGKGSPVDATNHKGGTPPELTRTVIGPIPQANGGVRVDLKGNVYVGMIVNPKDLPVPKGLEKNDAYKHCTGYVVKFAPEGGAVPGNPDMMTGGSVEGAIGFYPGISPFSHPHLGTTCCVCRIPRFDIDRYGRLAIPNAMANHVRLLDNAGNEVLAFGRYGNFDSLYKGGTSAASELPLAWPIGAAITDRSVYVLDVYNRRVLRADFVFAAEEVCDLK
ncbi:MAG TPA: hypothetical protein VEN81_00890 [Planctomycetota bacterium]|nr:hypothetical protein [Planctomycetota bacterium]